jgi:hypothetical protein
MRNEIGRGGMPPRESFAHAPRNPRWLLWAPLTGLLVLLCTFLAKSAFAEIVLSRPPDGFPKQLVLPPGSKLISVSWLCAGRCEPWTLTRPMRPGEEAQQYQFTNGRDTIDIRESKTPPQ